MQPPVRLGSLTFESLDAHPELIATPVAAAARALEPRMRASIAVAEIDPALADTAAFCERYGVALDRSANCVVLACRREGRAWFAACVILATLRIDVNGIVKRHVRASKISFASMDAATAASAMEYGGITPLGLPP
ncbi:MAG: hypothetical protein JOZ24_10400, partial [Candidatus Eremiobacteraeota bacterium]|nr:hypothetical protein [Candidatus Eremiobacteraeota bacterium]